MDTKKIKTLVIEDEPSIRGALVTKLEKEGFESRGAEDGEQGHKIAIEWQPDIIMLDILMPKMNGLQTIAKIRGSNEYGSKVPVIILTNVAPDDNVLKELIQYAPSGYFAKSDTKLSEISVKVREVLGIK